MPPIVIPDQLEPTANDPFIDRRLAAIQRYALPVVIVGTIGFLVFVGWLFSL